jgi:hypothetical protein
MNPPPAPDWYLGLPDRVSRWVTTLMDAEHFGLFKFCRDAETPFDLQSSAKALCILQRLRVPLEALPGHSRDAAAATVEYVQTLQDPQTGYFMDPYLEDRLPETTRPGQLHRASAKWAGIVLEAFGARPLRPFYLTGAGAPDVQDTLRRVREQPWDERPWSAGSQAASLARELFLLADGGRDEFLEPAREALQVVLSKQNPRTGMWGSEATPLHQQISGTLKVAGCFQWSLGLKIPHLDRLADSCIDHHRSGGFYADTGSHCIPRNVAEMCVLCLTHGDYRAGELRGTLAGIAEQYHDTFGQPDGAYAKSAGGTGPGGFNSILVCGPATAPRSDIAGTNGGTWCLGLIAEALGWPMERMASPIAGWRERVAALRLEARVEANGEVVIGPRAPRQ